MIERLYGGRVACVPYVMPGFALARAAADAYDAHPRIEGLVLINHGVFSFGATARESYERMIDLVTIAEDHIAERWRSRSAPVVVTSHPEPHAVLSVVRGVFGEASGRSRWLLDLRDGDAERRIADHPQLADLSRRGVATPDHVIRTKAGPLTLTPPRGDVAAWREATIVSMKRYVDDYDAYFARNNTRVGGHKQALDPLPRVVAIPTLGLVGVGRTAPEAAVAADIAGAWAETLMNAEAVGRFAPIGEADTFDMEYWSLEQAKLGKSARKRLGRRGCRRHGRGRRDWGRHVTRLRRRRRRRRPARHRRPRRRRGRAFHWTRRLRRRVRRHRPRGRGPRHRLRGPAIRRAWMC